MPSALLQAVYLDKAGNLTSKILPNQDASTAVKTSQARHFFKSGCIQTAEIIPTEQKNKIGMNPAE